MRLKGLLDWFDLMDFFSCRIFDECGDCFFSAGGSIGPDDDVSIGFVMFDRYWLSRFFFSWVGQVC